MSSQYFTGVLKNILGDINPDLQNKLPSFHSVNVIQDIFHVNVYHFKESGFIHPFVTFLPEMLYFKKVIFKKFFFSLKITKTSTVLI